MPELGGVVEFLFFKFVPQNPIVQSILVEKYINERESRATQPSPLPSSLPYLTLGKYGAPEACF